jgi:hypothetical protein
MDTRILGWGLSLFSHENSFQLWIYVNGTFEQDFSKGISMFLKITKYNLLYKLCPQNKGILTGNQKKMKQKQISRLKLTLSLL